jgi:hypothetical protein
MIRRIITGLLLASALAYSNHVGWVFGLSPVEQRGGELFHHK